MMKVTQKFKIFYLHLEIQKEKLIKKQKKMKMLKTLLWELK
ncbi:hypothetical protein HMPREF9094_0017 [Fusobacterium animalis ATCC 51191]|uniref:Uncharacterized protein n=1 Tax=Fusobacterium animalis ATCC 51191 TaxID=997347 RepID=F9EJB3_9FUSO|nr:hypothetical protein HMPREF9094_0017 [Fusobacterium animalis ATCC 51191]